MNLKNVLNCVLLGALCVGVADADWITSWGDGTLGTEFDIIQGGPTIIILKGDGNTYKFYSETSQGSGVPGVINNITVDNETASGDFTIWIQNDPTGAGASNLEQMNLTYDNGTSSVGVIWLTGDLGNVDAVTLETLDGAIFIDGDILNTLTVETWDTDAAITADNVVGTITINDDVDDDIDILDTLSGTVNINGDLSGEFTVVDTLSGTLNISGNMIGRIDINDTLSGTIDVTGDIPETSGKHVRIKYMTGGHIECNDMGLLLTEGVKGDDWLVIGHALTIPQVVATTHTGTVVINGELSGRVYVRGFSALTFTVDTIDAPDDPPWRDGGIEATGGFTAASSITVTNFPRGRIGIPREVLDDELLPTLPFDGTITISGSMAAAAKIDTLNPTSDPEERAVDIGAVIHVNGDMAGSIESTNNLTGQVRIDGSLLDGQAGDEIVIAGSLVGLGAVAVDWNGWDAGDSWADGATVKEGSAAAYTGNTPAEHVWEITDVAGDMNNDDAFNGADIDPFFLAIGDPQSLYEDAFPGLIGSIVFHGDFTCDGLVNGADIDPFFVALGGGTTCRGFNFMTPEHIAWLIETNVRPDRLERAILLVAEYVNVWARGERRVFWSEVLELLRPS
ncbi:MAG: hypothetical protein IH986_10455 [Planctomycetes bacterium]|nr:hypothetical protein [Planctomycetota bacterium]